MTGKFLHITVSAILVGLLLLLTDPFMVWMPMGMQMTVLVCAFVLVCFWAGLVLFERADDEREALHKMNAGRIAYLSGIVVLTIGLVVQGFSHKIDIWILLALAAMILSKLFSRFYSDLYR